MSYNHEETKVRDPSAAKEVERLREELEKLDGYDVCETCLKLVGHELAKKCPASDNP